jgi:hypothetical protein
MKTFQLDDLDKAVLVIAYSRIEESDSKRVSGSAVWDALA